MAIRDIVLYPDDPLTQVIPPMDTVGPDIAHLVRDMFETMDAYYARARKARAKALATP